jgi:RNA polymerase sigma factor (sigma-70 family)
MQQLLVAVHGNQQAMDNFARMNAGTISPAKFFAPENVAAILAGYRLYMDTGGSPEPTVVVATFRAAVLYLVRVITARALAHIDEKQTFVTEIERRHGPGLRRFLASRLRNAAADVPDLVQEVFLRLLRIGRHETIRSPEAYLITIASHVLHQYALRQSTRPEAIDVIDALDELESLSEEDPLVRIETQQRLDQLERALLGLSVKARTALILHRRDGYSLEEIGQQLGISRSMAKKYLAQALSHCRRHVREPE